MGDSRIARFGRVGIVRNVVHVDDGHSDDLAMLETWS
jgi:hypothetical protein